MTTVRQIQRLWAGKAFDKLLQLLLLPRAEGSERLLTELTGRVAAAALVVIRLDEMSQSFAPLYSEAVRAVLTGQLPDGGWGDPMLTALCVRALMCGRGHGQAIDRGLQYLGTLQKDEGLWPNPPVRRLPSDPFVSAFVLMQLGNVEPFRDAVRLADAVEWFDRNDLALVGETRRLWSHAAHRCRTPTGRPTEWTAA
jgi:hypothetical protein